MLRTAARRLALLPVLLLVIYTLTLTLAWLAPGSPVDRPEGRRPPPEVLAALEAQYNLDSFPTFYVSYLHSASGLRYAADHISGRLAREREAALSRGVPPPQRPAFDLGPSLQYEDWTVNEIIADSLPVSVTLGLAALALALLIGIAAGVLGALRPGSVLDTLTLSLTVAGVSLPSFVVAAALLLIFPVWLGIGRVASWSSPLDAILPAFTLALTPAAYIARLTRVAMIDALASDYIRTARAKGAGSARAAFVHALRNALVPVVAYLGPASAAAMTGSFVVEKAFNIPGLGQHFVNAVLNKDLFLIIAVVLTYSTILILTNLLADLLAAWIDPRLQ